MSALEGFPEAMVRAEPAERRVIVDLEASLYPLEAVYAAAYVFLDRCYVFLERPEPGTVRIVLAPKRYAEDELRAYAGELANELLSAAWRHEITRQNRPRIEAVTLSAIAGAMGPPSLDDLEGFDFSDEAFEDPLGIAMSWEEKYAKKKDEEST